MKIVIIMSDDRNLETNIENADYNSLAACINYNYSQIHNYDFIYYQPYYEEINPERKLNCMDFKNNDLRHPAWSKLLSTIKVMNLDYDYVVYIDSDAIFRNPSRKIEDFIEMYMGNGDILFMDNSPNPDVKIEKSCCSGIYIIKVNDVSKKYIVDWYNTDLKQFNKEPFWEQTALWWYNLKKMNYSVASEKHFHEMDGQMFRHLHSGIMGLRIPYFTNIIKEMKLDLKTNSKINWIQFDTKDFYEKQ